MHKATYRILRQSIVRHYETHIRDLLRVGLSSSLLRQRTARSQLRSVLHRIGCRKEQRMDKSKLKASFGSIAKVSAKREEKERTDEMVIQSSEGSLDWWSWSALNCGRVLSRPRLSRPRQETQNGKRRGGRFELHRSCKTKMASSSNMCHDNV